MQTRIPRKKEALRTATPTTEEEHCPKRLRTSDPDVKITVGGKTFLHYSTLLSNASDYFDAMLSSGMKEGETKTIEWPNKNPDELEMLYRFIGDPTSAELSGNTVETLIPWFCELRMDSWLKQADHVVYAKLCRSMDEFSSARQQNYLSRSDLMRGIGAVKRILSVLELSLLYELPLSNAWGLQFLDLTLSHYETSFKFFADGIDRLVSILKYESIRDSLLVHIKRLLPSNAPDMNGEELVNNPLLGSVLLLKAQSLAGMDSAVRVGPSASSVESIEFEEARP